MDPNLKHRLSSVANRNADYYRPDEIRLAKDVLVEIDRLERERDGFKKALEQIAANDHMTSPHPVGPAMGLGVSAGLKWNAGIARAALRSPEEGKS